MIVRLRESAQYIYDFQMFGNFLEYFAAFNQFCMLIARLVNCLISLISLERFRKTVTSVFIRYQDNHASLH
jgi:hypothetical protein